MGFGIWVFLGLALVTGHAAPAKPNVLWIVVEDMSAHFGCYGETTVETPHVDRLAAEGTLFQNAFVTAPVCSTSRSAMITGKYQTSFGAHHHRSGRGELKIELPERVRLVPALFQEAGYFTCNGGLASKKPGAIGKTDYNFEWPEDIYDGNNWSGRADSQPFFAQIQLPGGKARGTVRKAEWIEQHGATDPADVTLPPYYPDDPEGVFRDDWANYLDTVRHCDRQVGDILAGLEGEGILEETLIIFMTDHGVSNARGKQFCYEEGMRIPFILRGAGIPAGVVREDLASHIDMAPTSLARAGIPIPSAMHGVDLYRVNIKPRPWVISARDRCDETVERIRAVRSQHFKYIRNGFPQRPHLQPSAYKDKKPMLQKLHQMHAAGSLEPELDRLYFGVPRPEEEFFDLRSDPWEMTNLAGDPKFADELQHHREILDDWISGIGDLGQDPEDPDMYASDMKVYLDKAKIKDPEHAKVIEANIAQMIRWAEEGK